MITGVIVVAAALGLLLYLHHQLDRAAHVRAYLDGRRRVRARDFEPNLSRRRG
jgi:uncharacterized protein HemY